MPDTDGDGVLIDLVIGATRCVVTIGHQRSPACPMTADLLSPREHEIARMVADGRTNKEIASVLDISSWTVSTHLRRIFAKLDVTTRAAMVARLVDTGVASDPSYAQLIDLIGLGDQPPLVRGRGHNLPASQHYQRWCVTLVVGTQ
jgi:DNA-binding CsgD family transcriptional regulator